MNLHVKILTLLMFFWCVQCIGQTKRALVIGIGEQQDKAWNKINGDKDITYVVEYLRNGGFKSIKTLANKQATKRGIVTAFQILSKECQRGDIIYIHFSGHGQQMKDVNGDEVDGLDECWIPYDAYKNPCNKDHGEKHLSDDEINVLLKNIRGKIGSNGKILVVVDACHSGDSSRNLDDEVIRGVYDIFDTVIEKIKRRFIVPSSSPTKESTNEELWITVSACKSNELNAELKTPSVGKLTYAISQMLVGGKANDNKAIEQEIKRFVNLNSRRPQTPVISGEKGKYNIIDILK